MVKQKTVISVFAGCGGTSLGYKMAGYKELLAIEWDKNAVETFKLNFPKIPIWEKDITKIKPEEILRFCKIKKGELDILDGSPPCQGFSTAGKRIINDERNDLFLTFVELIKGLQPKVFVMENVSGMMKGKFKGKFNEILNKLKSLNYQVKCKLMNAKYYEVPQSRERLIFIGIRKDLKLNPIYPMPNKKLITVKCALKNMPKQESPPLSYCFKEIIPKMKMGQTVNDIMKQNKHFQTKRIYLNKPCPTIGKLISGVGFGAHIHPIEDRVLSIDEMKRLTSFPDDFKLIGKYQLKKARIGNSVPPKMMYEIAKTIKEKILND